FHILRVNPQARTWSWRVRFGPLNLLLDHGLDELATGTRAWVRIRGPWLILVLYRPLMWWALRRLASDTNLGADKTSGRPRRPVTGDQRPVDGGGVTVITGDEDVFAHPLGLPVHQ